MKRTLSLILMLVLCLVLLAGCGAKDPDNSTNTSDNSNKVDTSNNVSADGTTKVSVGVPDTLTTLGPFEVNTTARNSIMNCLYQPMFQIYNGEILPVIGESYEYMDSNDGGETYPVRIKLKENVYDSEGNQFTASDALFSIKYAGDHGFDEKSKYVDHLEQIDEFTLDVYFNVDASTMAGFFGDFACNLWMVCEDAYTSSNDGMGTHPVGTGPYVLKDFVSGSSCTLEVNEDFWQKDADDLIEIYKQNVDEIEFQFITDKAQIAIALQTGQIDMSSGVNTSDLVLFEEGGESADNFTVTQVKANKTYYVLFNCDESSACNDINLRRALSYCWDAAGIINGAFSGKGFRVYAMEGHTGFTDYYESWEQEDYFEYDPDLAVEYLNKYLDANGLTASQVNIRMLGDSGQVPNSMLYEVFQSYVQNTLGITCEIMYYESAVANDLWADPTAWDIYISRAASNTNVVAAWVNRLSRTTSSWGTSTMGFVDDQELEDLILTAWVESTHDEEHVSAVRDYVSEQCYMVGICGDYDNIISSNASVVKVNVDKKHFIMPGACEYVWNS